MAKLERITIFRPAFDKRSNDPKKNYGIGCVRCYMVLKGKEGATHFVFGTGMYKENVMEEWAKQKKLVGEPSNFSFDDKEHYFYTNAPMGYDVGYHSRKKQWEDQEPREKCEFLDNEPCYCDGSALRAEEWMKIFINEGSDKIWEMLEEEYKSRFKK